MLFVIICKYNVKANIVNILIAEFSTESMFVFDNEINAFVLNFQLILFSNSNIQNPINLFLSLFTFISSFSYFEPMYRIFELIFNTIIINNHCEIYL